MEFNNILKFATEYENRGGRSLSEGLRILDNLEHAVSVFLKEWVRTIPEEQKSFYRESIRRPIDYINKRRFHLHNIWLSANEVTVKYTDMGKPEMYITVTPSHILVRDKEYAMKESAFALVK